MKKRPQQWFIDLGHSVLNHGAVQDLPPELDVLLVRRPTEDRIVSYFMYFWTMAAAAMHSRVLMTTQRGVTWNLSRQARHTNIARFSVDWGNIQTVLEFKDMPYVYAPERGKVDTNAWLSSAFGPGASPFFYIDFLPDIAAWTTQDKLRLRPLAISEVDDFFAKKFGRPLGRRNLSATPTDLRLEPAAVSAIQEAAESYSRKDVSIFKFLSNSRDQIAESTWL